MQFLKSLIPLTFLFCLILFAWSCGNSGGDQSGQGDANTTTTVKHGEGKEYNSAYVCPMHCEGSGSEQPGKCPVCGMDYVSQAEHTENGHTH